MKQLADDKMELKIKWRIINEYILGKENFVSMPKSVIVLTLRTDSSEIGRIGDEILKKIICSKYFCDYGGNQPNLLVSVKNWRKNSCQRGVDEQGKILGEDCGEDNRGKQVDSKQNAGIFPVDYHQQAVTENQEDR